MIGVPDVLDDEGHPSTPQPTRVVSDQHFFQRLDLKNVFVTHIVDFLVPFLLLWAQLRRR